MLRGSPPRLSTSALAKKNTQEGAGVAEMHGSAGLRKEDTGVVCGEVQAPAASAGPKTERSAGLLRATAERQSGRSQAVKLPCVGVYPATGLLVNKGAARP